MRGSGSEFYLAKVPHRLARWTIGLLLAMSLLTLLALWSAGDAPGASAKGARLTEMRASPQWDTANGVFTNRLERIDGPWLETLGEFFLGGDENRTPTSPPDVAVTTPQTLATLPDSGLRVTWFGHSAFLVEIDGVRTLVDPIWSERASPFSWAGPKRFYPPSIPLEDLPPLDAVIISHDHYDHLDQATVEALSSKDLSWLVPLGVGAHLEHWGVPAARIRELDWWDDHTVEGVTITATPSRHFSGRSVLFTDQCATLWAGWAWNGPTHSLFYSGDTALHHEFSEIGERLGPFDITLMEIGAYNQRWADVHLGPEQALVAHRQVQGEVMIPVHWGLFDLALHGWTEPAERVIAAAERLDVPLAMIRPGTSFDISDAPSVTRWWPTLPWQSLEQAPAWSSGVESLRSALWGE